MRIKEMEKATGLTAKAIRLYESKGLLRVARQSENGYRDYSDEDVKRLKTIAVLRKLDVSIAEIKQWVDGEIRLSDLLHRVSAEAMLEARKADERITLAKELAKLLDEQPELSIVDAIEEAEFLKELYGLLDEIRDGIRGDLYWPSLATLAAVVFSVWTAITISEGMTKEALVYFGFSLLLIPNCIYRWYRYFGIQRGRRKKGCLWLLPVMVAAVAVGFGVLFFVMYCQRLLFAPGSGWYLFREPWNYISLLYPVFLIATPFLDWQEDREMEDIGETPREAKKHSLRGWIIVILAHLFLFYICLTGVSYYSEGQFIRHTVLDPMGKIYELGDIERVEAGFQGWTLNPMKEEGDFYYKITFTDGATENWVDLDRISGEDSGDMWQYLLELDAILMDAGVEKVSDWDNREEFRYDDECLAICDAILNNQ